MQDIAFYSFLVGAAANIILLLLLIANWQKSRVALFLLGALIASIVWNILLAVNTKTIFISSLAFFAFEAIRYSGWILLSTSLTRSTLASTIKHPTNIASFSILSIIILLSVYFSHFHQSSVSENTIKNILLLIVILIIIGIYSIENLYRGTPQKQRWSLKLLCLGLLGIFAYDLCMFSYLLLFEGLDSLIWSTRGIVSAASIPLMALAIVRNPAWSLNIFVSRQIVTGSFTLLCCSIYLAAIVFASIYVKSVAGSLADFFLALFIFSSLICLMLILLSRQLRYQVSVFINKHFFKNKYDYRIEWLKLIDTISNQSINLNLEQRIIKILADLAQTNGGLLWRNNTYNNFELISMWNIDVENDITFNQSHAFVESLAAGKILIFDPQTKNQYTKLPAALNHYQQLWLAIPLIHEEKLAGFVILDKTTYSHDPNWEDLDILKTVGRQLASYLMENIHASALSEAKQFEAFHQTTTFIIHDLRNLISQQSLLVKNAVKHKDKPEFIDDMVDTIDNSVQTMQKLIHNLHAEPPSSEGNICDLKAVLDKCVANHSKPDCKILLISQIDNVSVNANFEDLCIQIGHIIRNAQEAGANEIDIITSTIDNIVEIVLNDNGHGMSQDFIDNKLFKPFYTTKGATGMGIGAYEVRKYAREMGGDVKVRSQTDSGTEFTMILPIAPVIN